MRVKQFYLFYFSILLSLSLRSDGIGKQMILHFGTIEQRSITLPMTIVATLIVLCTVPLLMVINLFNSKAVEYRREVAKRLKKAVIISNPRMNNII